jgi:tetratricopeptide (TPR) repeat protein
MALQTLARTAANNCRAVSRKQNLSMHRRLRSRLLLLGLLALNAACPLGAQDSYDEVEILGQILSGTPSQFLAYQVQRNGMAAKPDSQYYSALRSAGASDTLIRVLHSAKRIKREKPGHDFTRVEKSVIGHMAGAAEFIRQKELPQGEEECRAALALLPERPVLHELLAAVLWQEAKRDSALAEYRESVRLQPNRFRGHFLLGSALSRTGDLNASVAEYREALRLRPESPILHNALGEVLYEKGETDAAISEFREAIRLWPDYFEAHFNMGNAFFKKGEWSEASARFRAAVRINPEVPNTHNNLGAALLKTGNLTGAIAEFREELRLQPASAAAHFNLGFALLYSGKNQEALEEFRLASERDPSNETYRQKYLELRDKIRP